MTGVKRKKVWITAGAIFLCFVLFVTSFFLPSSSSYYNENIKWRQGFGIFTYETLRHKSTEKEEQEAQPILKKVEEAFAYVGTEADCKIEEPYKRWCIFTDDYHDVADVKLITFKKIFNTGYIWVECSMKRVKKRGEIAEGSWDIFALIKVKRINGEWIAVKVIERP